TEEGDDRIRDVVLLRIGGEVLGADTGTDEVQCEVTDDLGGRGDLGRTTQHLVCGRVLVIDELEAVGQPQGHGLGTQVGQLTAGDLVAVDASGRARGAGFEGQVQSADRLPVRFQVGDGLQVETRVASGVREGSNQGGHRRLGGGAGQGCGGGVDSIGTGVGGGQVGGQLTTRGVVGVHVHGQVEFAAQGGDQLGCR